MRLTVLGSAASYAGADHACSGYLLESDGVSVLLDCGNGTIANATRHTDITALDAVLVSHAHTDHFADLYALEAALRFAPSGPVGSVPLHLPAGLWERMLALLPASGQAHLAEAFEPHLIAAGAPLRFGGLSITPVPVDHDGPTFAFVVDGPGARLVYTADTRNGEAVRDAAAGCDVLLAECTLPAEFAGRAAHLTATEAGRLAQEAGAGLLVLTHLWPTADHERMLLEASEAFDGRAVLATEGLKIDLEPAQPAGEGE